MHFYNVFFYFLCTLITDFGQKSKGVINEMINTCCFEIIVCFPVKNYTLTLNI